MYIHQKRRSKNEKVYSTGCGLRFEVRISENAYPVESNTLLYNFEIKESVKKKKKKKKPFRNNINHLYLKTVKEIEWYVACRKQYSK